MKKSLLVLLLLSSITAVCATELTKADYKQELKERGYLFGCTPVNWSVTEPVRGGFNYAAMNGEVDIMELEVKAGLDIKQCGKNLPLVLIQKHQYEALDFILKNGYSANHTIMNIPLLSFASQYKDPEIAKILIDNGADVSIQTTSLDYYPLNFAILRKQPEIVEILVNAGAKPNTKTKKLVDKTKNEEIKKVFENIEL